MALTKRVKVPSQQLSGLAAQQYLTSSVGDHRRRKLRQKPSGPQGPTHQGGERNLGSQRRANTAASKRLPARNGSRDIEQPSLILTWAKANGSRRRQRTNAVVVCSGVWVVAPREWSVTENREGLGIAKTRSPSREARPREMPRLADRVVVAEMPRDSTTLAEQRSRGAAACLLKRRPTLHALGPMRHPGHVVDATLRAHQTRRRRGRARPMRSCGPAALKPYWGTPAVRNFRGARGNGATVDAKRARNWKRRTQPSMDLRAIAPCVYSPHPQARVERGLQVTRTQLRVT
jgi:hypothetical protein